MCRMFAPLALALAAWGSAAALAQPLDPAAAAAEAAPRAPLTLAEAQRRALAVHPALAAARQAVQAAEGALLQAGAYRNPTLDVEREDLRAGRGTTRLRWSQPLELGGQRDARRAAAQRALEAARLQQQARESQLRADVAAAFLAALLAQERVRLAQASLDLARAGSQAAARRVQAGQVAPLEQTRAQVAEAKVRLERLQAEGEQGARRQELQALMAGDAPFPAAFDAFETPDGDALSLPALAPLQALQARLDDAPALRLARLETQRLAALADLERARRTPDLTLSAGVQRAQPDGRTLATVGLSIPLPVWDGNRGNITQALRQRDAAEDTARALALQLRADLAGAHQRFAVASATAAAAREDILPAAQAALDAATRGFELGKFGYLDLLDAQRSLLQARDQYLRALGEAHRAAADVARLLGDPSSSL